MSTLTQFSIVPAGQPYGFGPTPAGYLQGLPAKEHPLAKKWFNVTVNILNGLSYIPGIHIISAIFGIIIGSMNLRGAKSRLAQNAQDQQSQWECIFYKSYIANQVLRLFFSTLMIFPDAIFSIARAHALSKKPVSTFQSALINTKEKKIQEFLENRPKMNPLNPPPDPDFGRPKPEPVYALDQKMKAKSPGDQVEAFSVLLDKLYSTSNEEFEQTKVRYENFINSINDKQKITTQDLRDIDQFLCSTVHAMIDTRAYSTTIRQIISKNPDLDKSKINEAITKQERIAINYRCMNEAIEWCYSIADVYGRD